MADTSATVSVGLPLVVRDLTVRRPDGTAIVDRANITLEAGVALGLRGPSGAGKSTLLLAMAGLLDHAEGKVHWGQTDLSSLGTAGRARFRAAHLGIVFQDFLLFDELDALDNAAVAAMFRPRHARETVRKQAQTIMADLGLPTGRRRVDSFSGGERQRVAIARAMAANPPVLLADEPTASLDRAAADRLIGDLTTMVRREGRTLIVVSHDTHLLAQMDRVLWVEDGHITEGTVHA